MTPEPPKTLTILIQERDLHSRIQSELMVAAAAVLTATRLTVGTPYHEKMATVADELYEILIDCTETVNRLNSDAVLTLKED